MTVNEETVYARPPGAQFFSAESETLSLPPVPGESPPAGFPLIASLAPLAAAGVIWLITGSAFALVFAVLSPVIAIAGMIDARRLQRRARRREKIRYAAALVVLGSAVAERHGLLREARWLHAPSVADAVHPVSEANRWDLSDDLWVTFGSGATDSGLRLQGAPDPADPEPGRRILTEAALLQDAPISVRATGGIGIVGAPHLTRALARAVLLQLCGRAHPESLTVAVPSTDSWSWAQQLPHWGPPREPGQARHEKRGFKAPARTIAVWEAPNPGVPVAGSAPTGPGTIVIALAVTEVQLPPGCQSVVKILAPNRLEIVRAAGHPGGLQCRPHFSSVEQAVQFGRVQHVYAELAGLFQSGRMLPGAVRFTELTGGPGPLEAVVTGEWQDQSSLNCGIGLGEEGEVFLDLVRSGPHAVVGGTTGSGKSELLVTWVASMAARYPPHLVTFLLVDFKGGAAFAPLVALPHCVGMISDLNEAEAGRALASLAAELRFREGVLKTAGARDIADHSMAGALPRLVIVVDEFATMIQSLPQLHTVFLDIAARGRSLGVHLILCTQRPMGVVRDALLANCSLRLSLRVNNRADSQAVIGTDAAALLSASEPGRCLVDNGDGGATLCQVAETTAADISVIALSSGPAKTPRRPWLDPLPAIVTEDDLARLGGDARSPADLSGTPGYRLGLLDLPAHQCYQAAVWRPQQDGNMLVVGSARSGKSSLLKLLATPGSQPIPAHLEGSWDALCGAKDWLERSDQTIDDGGRVLLLDDFDSICARWDPDSRSVALELLTRLLRDGPARGLTVVLAVARLTGAVASVASLCENRLLLNLAGRDDFVSAGGLAADFIPRLPPGGGHWQGARIQLLSTPNTSAGPTQVSSSMSSQASSSTSEVEFVPGQALLVVSGSPTRSIAAFRAAAGEQAVIVDITGVSRADAGGLSISESGVATVFVGDADSWQAQWSLLSALRLAAPFVFDECGLADYRSLTRRRDLPPPLAPGHGWVLGLDGQVRRIRLPGKS